MKQIKTLDLMLDVKAISKTALVMTTCKQKLFTFNKSKFTTLCKVNTFSIFTHLAAKHVS